MHGVGEQVSARLNGRALKLAPALPPATKGAVAASWSPADRLLIVTTPPLPVGRPLTLEVSRLSP